MLEIKIGNINLSSNHPALIIAELSCNHVQNLNIARESVVAAKKAGADAIKLQTYTPDTITLDCSNEYFQIKQGTLWDGRTLYDLYKEAYTPWEWHAPLQKLAEEHGLLFFSSPFDVSAVDFLDNLKVPAYKVASFEITDIPLIEYIASKGKPVVISTGIAEECDIDEAVAACRRKGNNQIILLQCTSAYPAKIEEANLALIPLLREKFHVLSGLSDHTADITAPVVAVALGAKVIEKHFIIDRSLGGPDSAFSLEPFEFKNMVNAVRAAEASIGTATFELNDKIKRSREFARSLFISCDIKAGEVFTHDNVRSVRPAFGLHPKHLDQVLGKKAARALSKGTPLNWEMIEGEE